MFFESCVWATAHLRKDFQRALRRVEIESIQRVFTTVQSQIYNLPEEEPYRLTEQLDGTESRWRS